MHESIVYINGLFTPLKNAKVSILDRGFCYGDGLFETMRAHNRKVFRLEQHIERLFRSLPILYLDLPMTRQEVKSVVQETVKRNKYENAIIRLTLTRGDNGPNFKIDPDSPPTLVVNIRPHNPLSKSVYRKGAEITLIAMQTPILPEVKHGLKTCNFLSNILVRELSRSRGFMEGVIVDPIMGVTEGATSNLFVVKAGVLKTPPANNYVLAGITRQVVLEIARNHKIPILESKLMPEDVLMADEVFITNSGIDIVPVVRVDKTYIGRKKPGILTRFLQDKFSICVEEDH